MHTWPDMRCRLTYKLSLTKFIRCVLRLLTICIFRHCLVSSRITVVTDYLAFRIGIFYFSLFSSSFYMVRIAVCDNDKCGLIWSAGPVLPLIRLSKNHYRSWEHFSWNFVSLLSGKKLCSVLLSLWSYVIDHYENYSYVAEEIQIVIQHSISTLLCYANELVKSFCDVMVISWACLEWNCKILLLVLQYLDDVTETVLISVWH